MRFPAGRSFATVSLLCVVLLLVLHASHRAMNSDEGVVLNGAWNILNGRRPYFDFFEFIPPGAFYFFAAGWLVFGPGFWVAKALAIGVLLAGAAGVWACARTLPVSAAARPPCWPAAPVLFCLLSGSWPAINHNTLCVVLLVWSTCFAMRCILRCSMPDACVAGVFAGLASDVLLHRAAAWSFAFVVALACAGARDRRAWRCIPGFLAGLFIAQLPLLLLWDPGLLLDVLVRFPMNHYLAVNWVNPTLLLLLCAMLGLAFLMLRHEMNPAVAFLLGLQGALAVTALQRPDAAHVTLVAFPLVILSPLLASRLFASAWRSTRWRHRLLASAWALALPVLVLPSVAMFVGNLVQGPELAVGKGALAYVRAHCGAGPFIYAGPFSPGFYFESRRLNPTRYSVLLTGFNSPEQFEDARASLAAARPECVLTAYRAAERFGHSRLNPVDAFIASAYDVALTDGSFTVWRHSAQQ